MRCPKCDSPMPIGGKVCKNCNYNAFTQKYETNQSAPVQQQPKTNPAPVRPAVPQPLVQRTPANPAPKPATPPPTPVPKPVQQATPTQTRTAVNQKPKKKSHWLRNLLITLVAVIIGRSVGYAAGQLLAKDWRQNSSITAYQAEVVKKEPSTDFTALLTEHGISYTGNIQTMSSECFAMALDEYTFEILEYGYVGDTVKEQYDTIYYDVSGFSESEIQQIESNIKSSVEGNMPYCTAEYSRIGDQFFVVQLHIDDMDDSETISTMVEAGRISLTDGKVPDIISMEVSRQGLLNNGYIQ